METIGKEYYQSYLINLTSDFDISTCVTCNDISHNFDDVGD